MIGRIVGIVIGAVISITGYGMLKPAIFAKYFDFSKLSVGPFAEYKTLVCWMIVALGVAVALAALQRPSGGSSGRKKVAPAMFGSEGSEPAAKPTHGPLLMDPEPSHAEAHDDDHGHDDHGHDDDHHGHQVDHHDIHTPEPAH